MNIKVAEFFKSIKGKKVTFVGIGTSNIPLIEMFAEKGAIVSACDRQTYEKLGENAIRAEKAGAKLILGDDYLKNIDTDILFRSPGTPFYKEELEDLKKNILENAKAAAQTVEEKTKKVKKISRLC